MPLVVLDVVLSMALRSHAFLVFNPSGVLALGQV
jgi:hypothetical protein